MAYDDYIYGAAQANGVDPQLMSRISQIESSGNPAARTGSYKGLFQLSDEEFKKHGNGGDIYNAADNSLAAGAKLSSEIKAFNTRYGRDPTATEIYLTHQQGQGGFDSHNANPDKPAWQNMASTAEGHQKGEAWAKKAIWGNVPDDIKAQFPGGVDSLTSQQFMDLWRSKVEGGALTPAPQERKQPMPYEDQQPALAPAAALGGPGALFGGNSQEFFNRMANGFAMGRDDPSLGVAAMARAGKSQDEFSIHEGKDGSLWRLNKRTGGLSQVQPTGARPTTPGQKKVDEDYAKDYSDWTQGGYAESQKALGQLGEAHQALSANKGLTGPVVGNLPDTILGQVSPDSVKVRDQIYDTAQRSMKSILGAQFTQKEGEGILKRAFNPVLSDEENARRVGALMTSLQEAAVAKHEAAKHFQEHGTLANYKGRLPSDAFGSGAGSGTKSTDSAAPAAGKRPPLSSFAR